MGGPCPATPPSTDRTGEVLIALGKISRQPLSACPAQLGCRRATGSSLGGKLGGQGEEALLATSEDADQRWGECAHSDVLVAHMGRQCIEEVQRCLLQALRIVVVSGGMDLARQSQQGLKGGAHHARLSSALDTGEPGSDAGPGRVGMHQPWLKPPRRPPRPSPVLYDGSA